MTWDAFISHASEDKESFVRPLANELRNKGLNIWYDEFTLQVGNSLRSSIDKGLAESDFGIVVLSPDFFQKQWTLQELNGLVALNINLRKAILPIWHNTTAEQVSSYSPTLADRVALKSSDGLEKVVDKLLEIIRPDIKDHRFLKSLPESKQDNGWSAPLQPLSKANLLAYERNFDSQTNWDGFVLGHYEQLRRLFVNTMGQLIEAIEDNPSRQELDEIYGRLLGRQADPVGIFAFQPFLFLLGALGKELVEQAVLASPEYRDIRNQK